MSDQGEISATFKRFGHLDFVSPSADPFQATRHELSQPTGHNNHGHARQSHKSEAAHSNEPLTKAEALARASERVAEQMHTTFFCASGVQTALAAIGMPGFQGCGDAWQMGDKMQRSGKFELIPESEATRGDIGVQAWSASTVRSYKHRFHGQNLGDIFVVQNNSHGQIRQTNDHPQWFNPNSSTYDPSKRYFLRILNT